MIKTKLERFLMNRRCTLLGVGPMSKNCVDAAIDLANEYEIPIMLIASRRQIDAEVFGGGYVNNWSTERFAQYVIDRDKKGKIILARDHGGPWQNSLEKEERLSLKRAMDFAKTSFKVDIESGFEIIHIDTSVDIFGSPSMEEILLRLFELYEFCWEIARKYNREILFEIGTEEQNGNVNSSEELEYIIYQVTQFCNNNHLPMPSFVVAQTGTKVMETRNVGSFDSPFRIVDELPSEIQIPKIIDICNKHHIYLKEHNADYLSEEALSWHPKLGIHAANVAPEFGVTETKAFLSLLHTHNLEDLSKQFIQLVNTSKKWEKWMLPNSTAGEKEKAIIAGHYMFADARFIEVKKAAQIELQSKNIDIDEYLKMAIKQSILRYLKNFRMLSIS
ncbi:MAG TPA: class II D-tagatose-bisphosphate aldolase, non-catalytic subunit [Candidatus Babeliales bacterium]|nr:class II D-tagatose-bisphosphate aldolase, non-catalytic subunit [Candidatus Babeliales bacterium]